MNPDMQREHDEFMAPAIAEATSAIREYMRYLSSLGAAKGGRARAAALTPEQRSAIARRAANARWKAIPTLERRDEIAQKKADELSISDKRYSPLRSILERSKRRRKQKRRGNHEPQTTETHSADIG